MKIDIRIRRAGMIVALGLVIQILTLIPLHPLAFVCFAALGIPLTALGVGYFLLALVSHTEPVANATGSAPGRATSE